MAMEMKEYFASILTREARRQMKAGVNSEVSQREAIRKGIHRVPGKTEANAKAGALELKPLHHYVFCTHNVPYWRVCSKCGRDKNLARRNGEMILKKIPTLATLINS